jgi:hypothetical protein
VHKEVTWEQKEVLYRTRSPKKGDKALRGVTKKGMKPSRERVGPWRRRRA